MSAGKILAGILWTSACSGPPVVEEVLAVNQVRLSDGTLVTYAGLESPPPGSEMFEESRRANADLVLGKTVSLVVSRVGRSEEEGEPVEAFVYSPVIADDKTRQLFVNRELVLYGYARAIESVPTDAHELELWSDLEAAARTAKEEGVGLWAKKPVGGHP